MVLSILNFPVDQYLYISYNILLDKRILVRIGAYYILYCIFHKQSHNTPYQVFGAVSRDLISPWYYAKSLSSFLRHCWGFNKSQTRSKFGHQSSDIKDYDLEHTLISVNFNNNF